MVKKLLLSPNIHNSINTDSYGFLLVYEPTEGKTQPIVKP